MIFSIFESFLQPDHMQIRDENDKESQDFIIQNNKKTRYGAIFIAIVLVVLIALVAMTGVYFEYW